jgi:alcohol dehydrogenase YqhD (iron-dependent ADH family)
LQNFQYYTPTRVVFGTGTELKTGELVRAQGCRKALVHYGGQSAVRSGLLDRVCASLAAAGIEYVSLGGVVPNPRLSLVYEGIELCRKEGVDFLLAVGGGSVIDSAKAIAYGLANSFDVWDIYAGRRAPEACYPIGAVLTIPAAGSEMSDSSVITNEQTGDKRGFSSDLSRCKFAVMNPELTYTLPAYQVSCGVVDILMHTIERYFTKDTGTELTDALSEGLMRTVLKFGPEALKDPSAYNPRAQIMWAGSLSHNGLTGSRAVADWATHQLEHELSAMFDVAHGAGLAAVWGSWARFVRDTSIPRFAQFAVNVMGCEAQADPDQTALAGIEAMEAFFRSIGMPTSIRALTGVTLTEEQVKELAHRCTFRDKRTIGSFRVLQKRDMEEIYRMAR